MFGVGESALVDDEPRIHLAALYGAENAVVLHLDDLAEGWCRQPQEPEGSCSRPGIATRP